MKEEIIKKIQEAGIELTPAYLKIVEKETEIARQEERERIKEVFEREYKKRVEKEGEPIRWSRNEIFNIINH